MKKAYIIIIFIIEILALFIWSKCTSLEWHYSSFDLQLRLIADIHNDHLVPLWQTRLFHNKIIGTIIDTFNTYVEYWNITFLFNFISPIGAIGLYSGLYYWSQAKKKSTLSWFLVCLTLFIPLLEVFSLLKINMLMQIIILAAPFIFWSIFGFNHYTKNFTTERRIIIFLLIILSIWYIMVFQESFLKYCH